MVFLKCTLERRLEGFQQQYVFYKETYVEQYVVTYDEGGRAQYVFYQETYVEKYVATYDEGGRRQVVFYQETYENNIWRDMMREVEHKLCSTKKHT